MIKTKSGKALQKRVKKRLLKERDMLKKALSHFFKTKKRQIQRKKGIFCSRPKVARIMKEFAIVSKIRKSFRKIKDLKW